MSTPNNPSPRKSFIVRLWTVIFRPSTRFTLATLVIFGGVGGILFWGGFNWALESTESLNFCISCHEMRDTVYQEYKQTIHYKNPFGVRAICTSCHVPHPWLFLIRRKIQASNEVWHHLLGTINTPAKFEAHRLELAKKVWATMKANNSAECRNCHTESAMDVQKMTDAAQKVMMPGLKSGLTCIDCHMGIAHHLPKMADESEEPKKQ
jgi:trimethylamine-N-oxide reductase (cytochrome c), cytochrome c-type subunit TorC